MTVLTILESGRRVCQSQSSLLLSLAWLRSMDPAFPWTFGSVDFWPDLLLPLKSQSPGHQQSYQRRSQQCVRH